MRDHEILERPFPIDRTQAEDQDVPGGWKNYGVEGRAKFIPLVRGKVGGGSGFCAYDWSLTDSPESEILLHGRNHKMPDAASIWRHGSMLFFGFEPHPGQLNANGRRLLLNAIAYIARFTEERPIVDCGNPWDQKGRRRARAIFDHLPAAYKKADDKSLSAWFTEAARKAMNASTVADVDRWWKMHRGFLYPLKNGWIFGLEPDCRSLGVAFDAPTFLSKVIEDLEANPERARRLLARFAPTRGAPAAGAPAATWREWWKANEPYVFFSEVGKYRWFIDPLAKKRGVPAAELRGPARATKPPITPVRG